MSDPIPLAGFVSSKQDAFNKAHAPWVADPLALTRGGSKGVTHQINIRVNDHERTVLNAMRATASKMGTYRSDQDVIRGMLQLWFKELVETGKLDESEDLPYLREMARAFRMGHVATMERVSREQDQAEIEKTALEVVTAVENRTYKKAATSARSLVSGLEAMIARDGEVGRWALATAHQQNGLDEAMVALRENGHEIAIPAGLE